MITAIYVKDNTQLTIATREELFLEQMGTNERTLLNPGEGNVVKVGRGVFRVQSKQAVTVTASTPVIHVGFVSEDKDGGPIDQPKGGVVGPSHSVMPPPGFMPELDAAAVRKFLFSAKGASAP